MLHQKRIKNTQIKKQKVYYLLTLITLVILFVSQSVVYSQQYVIVDTENGDRLTGSWRSATNTHFEIEYNGQILRLPLAGHTLKFTSDLAHVPNRAAAKHFHNGLTLLELGLPENAQGRFEAAIEEFPKYPDAHYQLGLLYKANGDNTNALERFRFVAILDAPNFDLVPFFHELGDIALANEAYDVAVDSYQLVLTYYPEHPEASGLKYLTGFLRIEQLADPSAGLSLLESAIKDHPDLAYHEKALFLIGKLQADMDQLESALHTLDRFVTRYPESEWIYEAHLIRGAGNLKLGRLEEAASIAILVIEISDDENIKERAKQILDQTKWTVYTDANGLPDNHIQAITTDRTRLWIGTPKGIMLFETAFDKWIPFEPAAELVNTALGNVPDVTAIAANSEEVWIGTRSQGAIHYNQLTEEIPNYSPAEGFPAWVKDIKMDEAEVWFATDTGVIRRIRGGIEPFLYYNTHNSPLPADDIETLLLTPQTVWGASSEGEVIMFNREKEEWDSYHSTEIREGMKIVGLDIAEEQLLFTWFNPDEKSNGYFRADLDGGNGKSTTLDTGIENENDLRNIYIRGALDTSPIVKEEPEAEPVEEIPDPTIPEFSPGTEGLEIEPEIEGLEIEPLPPTPQIPLILWIATNKDLYTHHTRSADVWQYTTTPQILAGELIVESLVVVNNRVWLATSNGLATMNAQ
ncbi:tetratricopeptide repeat protein [Candidatus Poribacteria bacterium]|nr:tetratricopeptide repeat protein [Candidatus Poribacteria bacterium]